MKKYQVMIDDVISPQSFTLDELLDAGFLDDYDVNIKVRAPNETTWQVAREYPFNLNGNSSPNSPLRGNRIDEYGQVIRIGTTNNSNTSRLELSTTSLHFTSDGGSRSITINANEEWQISLDAASWVHLSKNGSNLMVTTDQNYGSESRTDYFKLKSGNIEKKIDIYQSGSSYTTTTPTSSNDNDGCSWIFWIAIGIVILVAIFS